jgi:type III secretion protein C
MSQSYLSVKCVDNLRVPTSVSRRWRGLSAYLAVACVAIASVCATPPAQAARIPFPEDKVSYDLQGESLKGFLERFFGDIGIAVTLSQSVQDEPGTLNGPRNGTPATVFKSIADSNGLVAYYDGSVAFVYKKSELSSRYFQIDPARVDAFREATIGFGLPDASNTMQIKASTGLVSANGTPRFLDQLAQLSTALGRRAAGRGSTAPQSRLALRFISLKYAWAADTTFTVGYQRTVIPGVATILNQLLSDTALSSLSGGRTTSPATVNGLRGKGLASLGDRLARVSPGGSTSGSTYGNLPGNGDSGTDAASQPAFSAVVAAGDGPRIVADPYRNALIIRDTADRIPLYEELVKQLDVESTIIQLEATVIDIDRSNALQLGIDWAYQHGNTSSAFGGGVHPVDANGNLSGLQVNSIISDASTFLIRVNALANEGRSNIVQRPQVVTLNDVEAVIENTQSVYVPVSGAFDEDLFGVMAGTVLRVTPHLITDNGRQRIRLLVSIEDGNVEITNQATRGSNGQTVTQAVPRVTRNAVNTQAIIDAGQGLLLGGLTRHETTKSTSKIPLLGSIPLLGRLFRSDVTLKDNMERLFLISPQIIVASAAGAAPAPPRP